MEGHLDKASDGSVYVRLDAAPPRQDGDGTTDQSPTSATVVEAMQEQIDTLKRELENWKEEALRKDASS
jgi:hypothetical protein